MSMFLIFSLVIHLSFGDTHVCTSACQLSTINCAQTEGCNVTCSGFSICSGLTINCPTDYECRLDCGGYAGCEMVTIKGASSSNVVIDCVPGGETCVCITVYCPENDNGEKKCTIYADNSLYGSKLSNPDYLQFYAVNGWNDLDIVYSGDGLGLYEIRGEMHCITDSYTESCDFNGAWTCSEANHICNNPPTVATTYNPTTTAPTTKQPTTSNPTMAPTTLQPTTKNPTTGTPTTSAPTTDTPTTDTPTTDTPTMAPTTLQPTTTNPTTATPTTLQPTIKPTTRTPTTFPTTSDPTTSEPTTSDPTASASTTSDVTTISPTKYPTNSPNDTGKPTQYPTYLNGTIHDFMIELKIKNDSNISADDILNVTKNSLNKYLLNDEEYKLIVKIVSDTDDTLIVDIIIISKNEINVDQPQLIADVQNDLTKIYGEKVYNEHAVDVTTTNVVNTGHHNNDLNKSLIDNYLWILYIAIPLLLIAIIIIIVRKYKYSKKNKQIKTDNNVDTKSVNNEDSWRAVLDSSPMSITSKEVQREMTELHLSSTIRAENTMNTMQSEDCDDDNDIDGMYTNTNVVTRGQETKGGEHDNDNNDNEIIYADNEGDDDDDNMYDIVTTKDITKM